MILPPLNKLYVAIGIVLSIILSFFYYTYINELYVNFISTAFSILSGFLLASISILGDSSIYKNKEWRKSQLKFEDMKQYIFHYYHIFYLYIFVLILSASSYLLNIFNNVNFVCLLLKFLLMFCSLLGLYVSLFLPSCLYKLQKIRIQEEIDSNI
jgi:hypothetical protein